ncbi:MAG: YqeG family HAD IIIA-type phosphatase [Clostridia bacterium]|nr:YqeG family HAD IIIA-type phosphatase [Clostridia bacterium]
MKFLLPEFMFVSVTDITAKFLKENNIDTLLLDADNTLSTHHSQTAAKGVPEWLEEMRKNGVKLMMVSNSKQKRVEPFANMLGLEFEYLSLKPLTKGVARAIKRLGADKKRTALVGDQIFTDVIATKLCGIHSIFVKYMKAEDKLSFKIRRNLEKKILKNRKYIGEEK